MEATDAIKEAGQHYLPVIYRRVIMALHAQPDTVRGLFERMPADRKTLTKAVARLREWGVIRVCDWKRSPNGIPAAVYEIGNARDMPKPKPLSMSERCRNWRQKKRTLTGEIRLGVWGL